MKNDVMIDFYITNMIANSHTNVLRSSSLLSSMSITSSMSSRLLTQWNDVIRAFAIIKNHNHGLNQIEHGMNNNLLLLLLLLQLL